MPFLVIRNDITKVTADVIVNTANPKPIVGGGTDQAIYNAAGKADLLKEREKIGPIPVGEIAVTPAFKLNAKYIIHCVGPQWEGGQSGEKDVLWKCYEKCLNKAEELECDSIAFPLMASGVYGFPNEIALQIAMMTMQTFAMSHHMSVYLVLFSQNSVDLAENVLGEIESMIYWEDAYRSLHSEYDLPISQMQGITPEERELLYRRQKMVKSMAPEKPHGNTSGKTTRKEKSFQDLLNVYFVRCGYKSFAELGRKCCVDSKYLSKHFTIEGKKVDKSYAMAICIGLRLDLKESIDLLSRAELAFNPSDERDRIVQDFIRKKDYNIDNINICLDNKGLKMLGSYSKE